MAPPNDPPNGISVPRVRDHEEQAHQLEALRRSMLGRWITSFDLQFPQVHESSDPTVAATITFTPTAFLACYSFASDGSFTLYQLRNKGGTFDTKPRSGTYTIGWDPQTDVAGGDIAITSTDHLVLRYLMRRSSEIHFIIDGANVPIPVAQGVMYKAELVAP
jgi:hypothetical protein